MRTNRHLQNVQTYHPPAKEAVVRSLKLDWNEALLPPPKVVRDAMKKFIDNGTVQRYGYPIRDELLLELSKYYDFPRTNILVTAGSDAAHDLICRTYIQDGDEVLIPKPTYGNFLVWPTATGAKNVFVPSNTKSIISAINKKTKIIYLVTPYSVEFTQRDIFKIVSAAPNALVVVDQAYFEYGGYSVAPLIKKHDNVIVLRSFSKAFRLAGLRIGCVLANKSVITQLSTVHNVKSINVLAQIAALESLKNLSALHKYVKETQQGAQYAADELTRAGFVVRKTNAGFLLFKHPNMSSTVLEKKLSQRGLLLRVVEDSLRMTAGPKRYMRQAIKIINKASNTRQRK